jgi:high-affinity iron transporter
LRVILIYVMAFLSAILLVPTSANAQDSVQVARRVAATARLAAQEYALGFENGRVVAVAEIEEAALFLAEAERAATDLPEEGSDRTEVLAAIDEAEGLVGRRADPDSVSLIIEAFVARLSRRFGVDMEEVPLGTPSLELGGSIYRANCAGCHGMTGLGDGPNGSGLDPAPTNLTSSDSLADTSPLDFYRRVTIGVAGTSMPSFEAALTAEERWAVAAYASTLRLSSLPATADWVVPDAVSAFPVTARMSDRQVLDVLGFDASPASLAAVRMNVSREDGPVGLARIVFSRVRRQLDSASEAAAQGDAERARRIAFDAYMTFEQVERQIRVQDHQLAGDIEAAFGRFRDYAATGASDSQISESRRQLDATLSLGEQLFNDRLTGINLFVQSFILLLREGLEAILVVGALVAFLVKTGHRERRRDIHLGVAAAVVASLLTAAALETVFLLSPARQEMLEGITMAVAAVMLFYVSYWLLSRIEVGRWNRFVQARVKAALTRGSAFALAAVAFLAVYREGFETVLFYKALMLSAGPGGWVPVLFGGVLGILLLVLVYLLINRFGVRLPLRPFFGVTGAFLYYMGFVFAGKAVVELQEGGALATTVIGWAPRVPALGMNPTLESVVAQGLFVALALIALIWILGVQRIRTRRDRETPLATTVKGGL